MEWNNEKQKKNKARSRYSNDIMKIVSVEIDPLVLVDYIMLSFSNKNSNIGQRESKIENPTKSPNEPPIDPNIPNPS